MNDKIKKAYQDTFNEIHAPEALAGKVKTMNKEQNVSKNSSVVKKIAVAAAAVCVLLVGSNIATYAATGSTWLDSVVVYFNGNAYYAASTTQTNVDGIGTVTYTLYSPVQEGEEENAVSIVETAEIVEKDGAVLLKDRNIELDLTEALVDGTAAGTYETDGLTYYYEVTGSTGNWKLSVNNGEYNYGE